MVKAPSNFPYGGEKEKIYKYNRCDIFLEISIIPHNYYRVIYPFAKTILV